MGRSHSAFTAIAIGACLAGAVAIAGAQQPQQPAQPRPQAPIKPYQVIAITLPSPINDAGFQAFRQQLGEVAVRRDKAALTRFVIAQGFFWKSEKGEKADKNKSGIDNLTAAIQLNAPEGEGWNSLRAYAYDPTAAPIATIKDVVCSPADPVFDDKELENLFKATQTDLDDWGYPLFAGVEVRSGRLLSDPVIEKLGLHFVRVLIEEQPSPPAANQPLMLRIVTPTGKTGFIPEFALAALGNDQLCYRKVGEEWKIVGYIGGEP